jgi:hypothetical protein
MFDIFAEYAVDPKAEQEGRWFPFGTGRVLVARAGNAAYNRMITARYEQYKHELSQKDTPAQQQAAERRSNLIMAEVMAHTVLLGYEDFGYQGKPIEYSIPNAQMMLEHKEFQRAIGALAAEFRNFRYQTEEADAKNSETTSAGNSSGGLNLASSSS